MAERMVTLERNTNETQIELIHSLFFMRKFTIRFVA